APILEVIPTDYGYTYAGIRSMGDEGTNYVRAYHLVFPWTQLRAQGQGRVAGHMWVPIDDYNVMVYNWHYEYEHSDLNARSRNTIDRAVQRTQTYTGVERINTQDRAVQESMGYIADRALERLGTTDRAIIAARRLLLQALDVVERGEDPPGVAPTYYKLRAVERVLPAAAHWYEEMKADLYQLPPSTGAVDAV